MEAVIFDMDGVIVDTEALHAQVKVDILAKYGIDCSLEECIAYRGRSSNDFFREYLADKEVFVPLSEIVAEKHRTFLARVAAGKGIDSVPGAVELIHELHAAGMRLALASSSARKNIEYFLKKLEIYDFFEVIASGAELPLSKPDPAIYRQTIEALGLPAERCAVIEDSAAGVLAAKRAGAYCIAFQDPRYHGCGQDVRKADCLVDDFGKLSARQLFAL